MSMRGFIGSVVMATLAAGCGVAGQVDDGAGATEGALGIGGFRCPDPQTDCTVNNGAGVYTEEGAYAGMGAEHFMITRFVNQSGGGVGVVARYFNSGTGIWEFTNGSAYYANYAGKKNLSVVAVRENLTTVQWILWDSAASSYVYVTDGQLLDLQVVISMGKLYTIDWDSSDTEAIKATIHKYNMRWRLTGSSTATQYCFRTDGTNDEVVFQQGMAVNPVNASVTRDSTTPGFVTLSCRYGAIATVRMWGYGYRAPADTYLYDSGLQMKRASYCGDSHFYTQPGTKIRVWDDDGIRSDYMDDSEIEAWWTPNGATCIGPMRHWSMGFSGKCNGVDLPKCIVAAPGRLKDAASPSAP